MDLFRGYTIMKRTHGSTTTLPATFVMHMMWPMIHGSHSITIQSHGYQIDNQKIPKTNKVPQKIKFAEFKILKIKYSQREWEDLV